MPSKRAKKAFWLLAAAVVLLVAVATLLPLVASTQIVRNRIAYELSVWSGYRVALRGAPRIDVWPGFHAVLSDVAFHEWGKPDAPVVLQAERIEIGLSAIAALRGEVAFARAVLFSPVLRVETADGRAPLPVAPGGGRMMQAITGARAVVEANRAAPDLAALRSDAFGAVEFIDGRIVAGDGTTLVAALNGRANWPSLNRAATVSAKGTWRGQALNVDLSVSQPLILLGGGASRLSVMLNSAPATASFEGQASLGAAPFFDGTARLASPSLAKAIEWSGVGIAAGATVGPAALSGRVTGDLQRLKIEGAELAIGGNTGNGVLELALTGPAPAVSGTLAFGALDLRAFLLALTHIPDTPDEEGNETPSFASDLNFDLRLSAAKATAGFLALADVAATAQVKDGFATFDVSDATVFGGSLQAGLRINRGENGDMAQIRFLAEDIETQALALALGMTGPVPRGRGSISTTLKGPAVSWSTLLGRASGSFSFRLGPGAIAGINLDEFLKRANGGDFFPLGDVSGGELPVEAAEIKATLTSGLARIDTARISTARHTIALSGYVPFMGRGLALSGAIESAPSNGGTTPEPLSSFFVGGSWTSPFISPILHPPAME